MAVITQDVAQSLLDRGLVFDDQDAPRQALPLRVALAGALCAGTLCIGLVTRGGGPAPDLPRPGGSSGLHFTAVGGDPIHFSGRLDRGAVLQGGDNTLRMELVFGAEAATGPAPRVPTDLVVVLDRSGSMAAEKMSYAKAAILGMIEQIGPEDRFALVTYADHAQVDIALSSPLTRASWRDGRKGEPDERHFAILCHCAAPDTRRTHRDRAT